MPVIQAKSAGFCYGVRRAVELAEKTARETGGCVMLGSLIHNANVVARLEQLGARQVDSTDEVHPGDTVIIRSHGETRQVLERLEAMGARCVNATCPNVLHIQHIVSRAGQAGRMPLVIGEPHTEEATAIRAAYPQTFFLIPGYGAQGGKAADIAQYMNNSNGGVVNSSRGILLAYKKQPGVAFDEAAYNECVNMKEAIAHACSLL